MGSRVLGCPVYRSDAADCHARGGCVERLEDGYDGLWGSHECLEFFEPKNSLTCLTSCKPPMSVLQDS